MFDEGALAELAASIQSIGIIQPPVVRAHDGGYLLISGERRWRAARQLGLEKIDVIVRDDLSSRAQLVENIQREALSPWEIYRVIAAELDSGTTQADLARSIGKSRTWVTAYAAVNHMPDAASSFARKTFGQDYEYLLAHHNQDSDPKRPDNPHAHLTVKTRGRHGQWLNPRKHDLQAWREAFALELRERGAILDS